MYIRFYIATKLEHENNLGEFIWFGTSKFGLDPENFLSLFLSRKHLLIMSAVLFRCTPD